MPDTSSAAYRRHAEWHRECRGGIEPLDGTWFETGDERPVDRPLLLLVPVSAVRNEPPDRASPQ